MAGERVDVSKRLAEIARETQSQCDHGVTFDEEAARQMLEQKPSYGTGDAVLDCFGGTADD